MTKAEMYAGVVKVQKATAQGVPGNLIKQASREAYDFLVELKDEGRLKVFYDTEGMVDEEWFYPATGYSIWNAIGREAHMRDMLCARYHLNMLDENSTFEPSREQFAADESLMLLYKTWYELHKDELEVMANLSETY